MMEDVSEVADAYAQGLLQAGMANDCVSDLLTGAAGVLEVLHEEPRFEVLLAAPHIRATDKERLLDNALNGRIPTLLYRLILLVVRRHRGNHLREILVRFRDLATEKVGRVPTLIRSAVPLSKGMRRRIENSLERLTQRDLDIQWQVDPELLGGLLVSFDDFMMDGTIRQGLQALRASLMMER